MITNFKIIKHPLYFLIKLLVSNSLISLTKINCEIPTLNFIDFHFQLIEPSHFILYQTIIVVVFHFLLLIIPINLDPFSNIFLINFPFLIKFV